ncbi:hypothetical protein D8X92_10035 [Listeria ivanovii]|nr:hypothetical protein [Listeria ivanovii]MBM5721042.1 hypothetical protein [Listeria ivanovii]
MERDTNWVQNNLINQTKILYKDSEITSEQTGLHELEFIQTERHWFTGSIILNTNGSVNMLNLVEGETAQIESLDNSFHPFIVHYGETFIVPEQVKTYRVHAINPTKKHAIIQAFVKN